MRDGRAGGQVAFGPFHIHVNPLMIAGCLGELVYHLLIHGNPFDDAHFLADILLQVIWCFDGKHDFPRCMAVTFFG